MLIGVENVLKLVFTQQSVVDEYTCESVADCLVQQHCRHGRIDTSGESEYHTFVTEFLFKLGDCSLDE